MWNIDPWQVPALLMAVGKIIAWVIVLYGIKLAVEIVAWQVPKDADITAGVRQVTDEWLRVRPPAKVRRRPYWKYIGLWLNNIPGSLLVAYAMATGRWWVLIVTVALWYWAGQEFTRQAALDRAAKYEEVHDEQNL